MFYANERSAWKVKLQTLLVEAKRGGRSQDVTRSSLSRAGLTKASQQPVRSSAKGQHADIYPAYKICVAKAVGYPD